MNIPAAKSVARQLPSFLEMQLGLGWAMAFQAMQTMLVSLKWPVEGGLFLGSVGAVTKNLESGALESTAFPVSIVKHATSMLDRRP